MNGALRLVTPSLVVTAGAAYAAGMCVGGLLELDGATRLSGQAVRLDMGMVVDAAKQNAAFDMLIFNSRPAAAFADHVAAPTLTAADAAKVVHRFTVMTTEYVNVAGVGVTNTNAGPSAMRRVMQAVGDTLYAAIVTNGTPTYVTTADLIVRLAFADQ